MRRLLEATGDYRVLRRLREIDEFGAPSASSTFVAAYLDIETTGLDPERHSIIELALVTFEYDLDGNVHRILGTSSQLEDPGEALPPEIVALTGLTDHELAGQKICEEEVAATLADARLVIAHNAAFDRPFVERRLPLFSELPWACSIDDVGWAELGFATSKLEYLAYRHGFFYDAHRALNDCRAGVEVLRSSENGSGRPAMALLRENALRRSVRLWAEGSPFHTKDVLRQRGYRWCPEARSWWTERPEEEHEAELEWLAANVYGRRTPLPYVTIDAADRYSARVTTTIPRHAARR